MKSKLKKIIVWSVSITAFLAIVLAIHIYVVTRPKVDEQTIVMARIDIKQPINQDDATRIARWLYQQKVSNMFWSIPKLTLQYLLSTLYRQAPIK